MGRIAAESPANERRSTSARSRVVTSINEPTSFKGAARWLPALAGALAVPLLSATAAFAQDAAPVVTTDTGDTAWVLAASALVLMMTLPGLALFYGGLVRSRNVLNVFMQCFLAAGMVGVLWVLIGYSLAFGT